MPKFFSAGKWYGHALHRVKTAAYLTGIVNLFQIVKGPIRLISLGALVTTVLPAGANTLQFKHTPTGGSATALCGATDTASAAAQAVFAVDGVKATALVKNSDTGILLYPANLHMPLVLSEGLITAVFSAGPPASGVMKFFMEFEPVCHDCIVKYI